MANNSEIQKLANRLQRIEMQLEKVRGCSPITHGWQTQRFAKASRKWDELAKEKMIIKQKIEDLENGTDMHDL